MCRMSGYKFLDPDKSEPYDLMVDFGAGWKKVQVKSSYQKRESDHYYFRLVRHRTNTKVLRKVKYTNEDVDYFFLMDVNLNCWLIPFDKLVGRMGVIPSVVFSGFKVSLEERE